jgi:hypothetical protein
LGTIGIGFQWGKMVFMLYYTNKYIFCHLFNHWGAGRDGCRQGKLDNTSFLGSLMGGHKMLVFRERGSLLDT